MNRKLIIIVGKPNNADEGTKFSCLTELYEKYFESIAGGAFEAEEIIILNQISLAEIESNLSEIDTDYAIFVLIGHGATINNNHALQLNSSEIILPGQLLINATKKLIIIESCRNVIEENIPVVDLNRVPSFREGGVIRPIISRDTARERFFNHLENTVNGTTICMSCSTNQSAYGFFFSSTLLTVGHSWHIHTKNYGKCIGIIEVITTYVAPHVTKLAESIKAVQVPEILGDGIDFPFSVCRY